MPVTVVESVDGGASELYLSVHTTDLLRNQINEPADVFFVEAKATPVL